MLWIVLFSILTACGQKEPTDSQAQQWKGRYPGSDFQKIDRAILNLSASDQKSLAAVARAIGLVARTDWEKIRGVWCWITHNIAYDVTPQTRKNSGPHAEEAFRQKRAVCSGYSRLFADLAQRLGLEVFEVRGYVKDETSRATARELVANHAWNIAKIDGTLHLFDPTWGAGSRKGRSFRWHYKEIYFDASPEQFVFNHFPQQAEYQLLNPPLDQKTFFRLPYVNPTGFAYGLQTNGLLQRARSGGKVTAPRFFKCALAPTRIQVPMRDTLIEGQNYRFRFSIPAHQMIVRTGADDPVFIDGEEGHFDFSVNAQTEKLVVGVVTSSSEDKIEYSYLVAYKVQP
nr:transglutaminase domain-containing protein [uncultured Desulfobulbus sp.]